MQNATYKFFELYSGSGINSKLEKYVIVREKDNGFLSISTYPLSKEKNFYNDIKKIYPDERVTDDNGNEITKRNPLNYVMKAYTNDSMYNKNGYYKKLENEDDKYIFYNLNISYQNIYRNMWLKDKHVYDEYLKIEESHPRLYNFFKNIYGLNVELFLDNMAFRLAEFKKQKVLFMVGSKLRYIGKGQSIDLITKTFSGNVDDFDNIDQNMVKIESGSKWTEVEPQHISLVINEHFVSTKMKIGDISMFDKIKELQGQDGGLVEGKGKKQRNVRCPILMTFNTFNVDLDNLDEKFYVDQSNDYKNYIFYSNNKEATNTDDFYKSYDWNEFLNNEAPIILAKHLLARYTYMFENDIDRLTIARNDELLCKNSKYDIEELNYEKVKKEQSYTTTRINAALIKYCLDDNIEDFRLFVSSELNLDLSEFNNKDVLYYKEWKYISNYVVDKKYLIKGWFGKCGDKNKISKTKEEVSNYLNDSKHKVLKDIFETCFGSVDELYNTKVNVIDNVLEF